MSIPEGEKRNKKNLPENFNNISYWPGEMETPGFAKNCIIPKKEIYETIETIILLRIGGINVCRLPVLQKSTLPTGC